MSTSELPKCPFCGFKEGDEYRMLLHVELNHSEDGHSPFAVKDQNSTSELTPRQEHSSGTSTPSELEYVACPSKCGELIHAAELQFHIDMHIAEGMALDEAKTNVSDTFNSNISTTKDNHQLAKSPSRESRHRDRRRDLSWKDLLFSPPKRRRSPVKETKSRNGNLRRLGKAELGPFANEKRMPNWLVNLLEEGGKITITNKIGSDGKLLRVEIISNETSNLIPVLARLSTLDDHISKAFYCNPAVRHIAKLPREGGFCGYRNLQMLISYIQGAQAPGFEHFKGNRTPSIFKLQDLIENAWDQGFNETGREETGGVRMTRKYIGTPEAQALLLSLGIAAEAMAFSSDKRGEAYLSMISAVCQYFGDDLPSSEAGKVMITDKPPLYFQHQGHSMTVVGVEVKDEGRPNLVVFDPMYNTNAHLKDLALTNTITFTSSKPAKLLKLHRRDAKHLDKYKAFEMIKINGPV